VRARYWLVPDLGDKRLWRDSSTAFLDHIQDDPRVRGAPVKVNHRC